MKQKDFILQVAGLRPALQRQAETLYQGNVERAEDAVSELLLRLWQRADELDKVNNIGAYCHTLLRNWILDDLRRAHSVSIEELVHPPAVAEEATQYELGDMLHDAIRQLPELRRRVYELHELQGYECHEIAAITGLRTDAIHNHLSRARKQMRDYLLPMMK